MTDDGGPAFPRLYRLEAGYGESGRDFAAENIGGMTLRDWFAGMALQGRLANPRLLETLENNLPAKDAIEDFAVKAYMVADAMLKERDK